MTHADDRTLVALLDGEPTPQEWNEHVELCLACRNRLAELERQGSQLRRALEVLPIGDPGYEPSFLSRLGTGGSIVPGAKGGASQAPSRRGRGFARLTDGRRWAVAAAAVLALLFMVPQARAWLVETVASVFGGDDPGAAETATGPAAPPSSSPTEVSAPVTRDRLVVELEGEGAPGRLVLRRSAGALATVRLLPADAGGEILVVPTGFRVLVQPDASTLELDLPPTVRVVEVRRDGRTLIERTVTDLDAGPLTVPIGGG